MKKCEIRWAKLSDFEKFKELPPVRSKAIVVEEDGEPVVLGGLLYFPNSCMAYMQAKRTLPVSIMKATKKAMTDLFLKTDKPIYASRDMSIESSGRYLERIGFVPIDEEMYIWRGE